MADLRSWEAWIVLLHVSAGHSPCCPPLALRRLNFHALGTFLQQLAKHVSRIPKISLLGLDLTMLTCLSAARAGRAERRSRRRLRSLSFTSTCKAGISPLTACSAAAWCNCRWQVEPLTRCCWLRRGVQRMQSTHAGDCRQRQLPGWINCFYAHWCGGG
jgi:hypothetical protein